MILILDHTLESAGEFCKPASTYNPTLKSLTGLTSSFTVQYDSHSPQWLLTFISMKMKEN